MRIDVEAAEVVIDVEGARIEESGVGRCKQERAK